VKSALPRVSVIIPALNAADTLTDALDSLISQSLADWEAIVVDDGSTDATFDLAFSRSQNDPRIRVFRQENQGASGARNSGIAAAQASRLVFLDSDDWLAPDHLTRLHQVLETTQEPAVAYCGYVRIRPDGSALDDDWSPELAARPFEVLARRSAAAVHCVMVSRELVLRVGGFDTGLATCEEWDLWQRIARTGTRFVGVPELRAFYRQRQGSLSSDVRRMVRDAIDVISRARGPDARVPKPDPRYANGISAADGSEWTTWFVAWCAASQAAKGIDAANLFDEITNFPDLGGKVDILSQILYHGFLVGGSLVPAEASKGWPRAHGALSSILAVLERRDGRRGLHRQISSALERRILAGDVLEKQTTLNRWSGLRIDIREPIPPIALEDGIDGIHCRVCAGDAMLTGIELPVFGPVAATTLAHSIITSVGLRATLWHGRLFRRARFWTAFGRESLRVAPQLAWAGAARLTGHRKPIRGLATHALRRAVHDAMASGGQARQQTVADETAEQWISQERAVVSGCQVALENGARKQREVKSELPSERKQFWEKLFENPDPWNYESAYEQRKYERTLSILGDEPIDRALELACAEGIFTAQLGSRVGHLVAADISEQALARAQERCRLNSNIEFRQIDFFDDPIPGNMNLIVCSEVLYYLKDKSHLALVAEKLAAALAGNGRLVTAHAFLLVDDPTRTGFDWGHPFGVLTISEAFEAAGLALERSIQTDLYRVDLFRRPNLGSTKLAPDVTHEPLDSSLEAEVEREVVWGGAVVRRADLARHKTTRIPVLLYHRIAEDEPASLSAYRVSPRAFEEQMRFLRRHGYHAITSNELEWHCRSGRPMHGRPVLITFDDGYRDFYESAWPILRRAGFTAEVFVPTDLIGKNADWDHARGTPAALMSWDEIATAHAQGAQFGSHLASHTAATALSSESLLREAARSRAILERRLGCSVHAVALPYGDCDERTLRILQQCGFSQIFSTEAGLATTRPGSPMVPRIEVSGHDTIDMFAAKLGDPTSLRGLAAAPLVSAVVSAYNTEKTIAKALHSIRAQTGRVQNWFGLHMAGGLRRGRSNSVDREN
jgi:glycosyltransferase involved in cell wall biosynthesis/peptidoglycan/xylan/chitin deacetylase (PgdA/CDA1 family)